MTEIVLASPVVQSFHSGRPQAAAAAIIMMHDAAIMATNEFFVMLWPTVCRTLTSHICVLEVVFHVSIASTSYSDVWTLSVTPKCESGSFKEVKFKDRGAAYTLN